MSELVGLVREFPFGSFIIILSVLWACERVVSAFINRNKPSCDCDCCNEDEDDIDPDDIAPDEDEE